MSRIYEKMWGSTSQGSCVIWVLLLNLYGWAFTILINKFDAAIAVYQQQHHHHHSSKYLRLQKHFVCVRLLFGQISLMRCYVPVVERIFYYIFGLCVWKTTYSATHEENVKIYRKYRLASTGDAVHKIADHNARIHDKVMTLLFSYDCSFPRWNEGEIWQQWLCTKNVYFVDHILLSIGFKFFLLGFSFS